MKSLEYLATRNAGRFDIVEKDGPRTVFRLALDNGASLVRFISNGASRAAAR